MTPRPRLRILDGPLQGQTGDQLSDLPRILVQLDDGTTVPVNPDNVEPVEPDADDRAT